jgi:nucleotide-binding universal stress UspA family protein
MSSNILLAVDVVAGRSRRSAGTAVQLASELVRDSAGHVVVLYVREFSVLRIGQMVADRGGTVGKRAVDEIVAGLRAHGVDARGLVREADAGHVAQVIIDAAQEADARMIVLGAGGRPGSAHLPLGSVAARVLHRAPLPVLIVRAPTPPAQAQPASVAAANCPSARS